jgi:hypothetical protein
MLKPSPLLSFCKCSFLTMPTFSIFCRIVVACVCMYICAHACTHVYLCKYHLKFTCENQREQFSSVSKATEVGFFHQPHPAQIWVSPSLQSSTIQALLSYEQSVQSLKLTSCLHIVSMVRMLQALQHLSVCFYLT